MLLQFGAQNMTEETFVYSGKTFLIQKVDSGQLKIFRKKKAGLEELHGHKAYQVARAYKLKIEKTPSAKKPRVLANRFKRKKF